MEAKTKSGTFLAESCFGPRTFLGLFKGTILSYKGTIRSFKETIRSFKETFLSYKGTIRSFKETIRSFKETFLSYKGTIRSFKETIRSFTETIRSFVKETIRLTGLCPGALEPTSPGLDPRTAPNQNLSGQNNNET